jgi:hypothetical protein
VGFVGKRQQPLLCAVVQVPFQLTTLGIAGLHNPDPGGTQLVEVSQRLGLQALVLQSQPDSGADPWA